MPDPSEPTDTRAHDPRSHSDPFPLGGHGAGATLSVAAPDLAPTVDRNAPADPGVNLLTVLAPARAAGELGRHRLSQEVTPPRRRPPMRITVLFASIVLVSEGLRPPLASCADAPAPLVFRGATVYDGTGGKPFVGDVHIKGDKLVAVGPVGKVEGAKEIDAKGLIISPGFIDLHTHCDSGLTGKVGRLNKNYVTQGCTTVVTGNCGSGPVDVGDFFKKLEAAGVGTNVIHLAPHNSIRARAMGNANRAPTAAELKKMEELVEKAMADGAWGLATGLIYNPGTYAKTDEIVALAKVAGARRAVREPHPQRVRRSTRRHRGGADHREAVGVPRSRLAHQGQRQGGVGHGEPRHRADRVGAEEGPRRDRGPVPLRRQLHVPARHTRAVQVPRGYEQGVRRAPRRPGNRAQDQGRRRQGARRARRRQAHPDRPVRAQPEVAGEDDHRDRRGREEGPR
ncbi:MAG: amidohydrolase family protein [Planctomycetes bacterium]|nr:amidohydrolase family protein [Planctomycetota bacterium]